MCTILSLQMDVPYLAVRQILCRSALDESQDVMTLPQRGSDLTAIPEETRYSLIDFLTARQWTTACDILAEHPSLVAPWASDFLRGLVLGGRLSWTDFVVFGNHIFVLDLAQTLGIGRTRAFLNHLGW
jgi:hypothetical protein